MRRESQQANMKRPAAPLLWLVIGSLGWASLPLGAQSAQPVEILRGGGVLLTADEEAQDARELAAMINDAANLHREVTIELTNGTAVVVGGRVTVQRYWLQVPLPDRSEIRFRASLVASVKFK